MPIAAGGAVHVGPIRGRLRGAAEQSTASQVSFMTAPFDLPGPVALRRSYIIASTPRCGSTFLSTRLCAAGVLGAPAEYFSYQKQVGTKMMARLAASTPADYLQKLLACRTSKNGIFGMNIEFNDFEEVLRRFPDVVSALSPVTYIYVDRQDQTVQAAFMAKAVQTDARASKEADAASSGQTDARHSGQAVQYNRDLIAKWLGRIERQKLGWTRWFAANGIVPFVVNYEHLTNKPATVIRSIIELLGVQNDEPQKLRVALAERPSDRLSAQWAARFEHEIASGIEDRESGAAGSPEPATKNAAEGRKAPHVFDRYDQIKGTAAGAPAATRLRRRYEAIIATNRALFNNARVLDVRCGDGCWGLAALDAGAAHLVGIDSQKKTLDAANNVFTKIGVKSASYRFVNKKMFDALRDFSPEGFDLILCREVSSDPHFLFECLQRLRPKHVILDTKIIGRKEPSLGLRLRPQSKSETKAGARSLSIVAVPNHALITRLCGYFGFRWRMIDWHALGIADWTGVEDYQRDRRRTYVLDRIVRPGAPRAS